MGNLNGIVAVVTGAARGIGSQICLELSAEGALVIGLDFDGAGLKKTFSVLPSDCLGIVCDLTNRNQVEKAVQDIVARYGGIDILVNNAGITQDALFHKMSVEEWNKVIDVNLNGVFHVTQFVQASMVKNRLGRIVFISSRSALGNRGQANYAATKAAVQGLTKTLAIELGGFGITVNAIAPGFIDTEMTREICLKTGQTWEELTSDKIEKSAVKRVGLPADVANAVLFFCSPKSSFITGQVLYVTGSPSI